MKTIIFVLAIVALASAAPKPGKLHFRNLYKNPPGEIIIPPKPRIIGGEEAAPHSRPYQAFMEVDTETEGWYCGGSLLSENYVMTAGHCGEDGVEAFILLGAHNIYEEEDTQLQVHSTNIKVHEDWDSYDIVNDISVIKLDEPLTFTDAIQPVTLPTRTDANKTYADDAAIVSGWGLTDGFANNLAQVLNYVDLKVLPKFDCEDFYGDLPDSQICTSGDANTGTCNGDSGGPLTVDGVQVGIVSWGIIFCLYGFPSVYTRVTSYLDWIEINTDVQIKDQ